MKKICLVAPEIAPFTSGGIGVLLHNLIKQYQSPDTEFHVLELGDLHVADVEFKAAFPNVVRWNATELVSEYRTAVHPPEWAFTTHAWHFKSYQAARALQQLRDNEVVFDVVEFPDWGGLAFCSCQDKLLHGWNTLIAVRLHSTDSILRAGQPSNGGAATAILADLERKALRDADIVIAHLDSVARATKSHFGFDDAWFGKVRVDAPPVAAAPADRTIAFDVDTSICFPSKIQALKGPEVFLNGVLAFLAATPDYQGKVIFLAHPTDVALRDHLASRIPKHLVNRVSFVQKMGSSQRNKILSEAISVFPSPFESFCLAAYEVSAAGGITVLNGQNPAFADGTPWIAGRNCLKFDGTAFGLYEVLGDAWKARDKQRLSPVSYSATPTPYWNSLPEAPRSERRPLPAHGLPLVSVIVPYFNMGRYIMRTIESVMASSYPNVEIIIVDDASDEELSKIVLDKIAGSEHTGVIKVVRSPANMGLSAARNLGVRESSGDFILTLDSDDLIRSDFIDKAVQALIRNDSFSIVVPQTAFVTDESSSADLHVIDYALFVGEALRTGTFANRFSTATSLGRKHVFVENPYDENLNSYEDWDFYVRLVRGGHRFIVSSDLYFYYRRRQGSMIATNTKQRHARNISRIRAKQEFSCPAGTIDMNVVSDAEAYSIHLATQVQDKPVVRESEDSDAAYIAKLKAQIAHQNVLLRDAGVKVAPIQFSATEATIPPTMVTPQPDERPRNWAQRYLQNRRIRLEARMLRKSGMFDSGWYLAQYPDVANAGVDAAEHFVKHGRREGRAPNSQGIL